MRNATVTDLPDEEQLSAFRAHVWTRGRELFRTLPWRDSRDPYEVLVSEVMLQQTQVKRVLGYWPRFLAAFPTLDALAAAPTPLVLEHWQGLGYNRRALALKRTAETCAERYGGYLPVDHGELVALPGIGPATAAGVRVFAHGLPDIYLETNVRTVVLHELFPDEEDVPDRAIVPVLEATCDEADPRGWYYALLDYGAHLKSILPNPSRRSRHHARQSTFEGSHRQKRAWLLRELLAGPAPADELTSRLASAECKAGRAAPGMAQVEDILVELASEHFIESVDGMWRVKG
jgi:A/G-specific adenine glycosylase